MSRICLQSHNLPQSIVIPGSFIEQYMVQANGEFVKVYLCLLHRISTGKDLDCSQLADTLMCTEGDVLRALRYWNQTGLIHLTLRTDPEQTGSPELTSSQDIESISLCDPSSCGRSGLPDRSGSVMADFSAGHPSAETSPDSDSSSDADTASRVTPIRSARKASITPERVRQLKENEEIRQLLYIAEQYLGRTLTASEMQRILLFYDDLHMSIDLIDYLIEYCVSHGHTSIQYIETVAHAWTKEGITTVAMAKQASSAYRREFFTVLKALGITGRNPVDSEIRYMKTWFDTYGFPLEIVLEACSRTVIATGKGAFQYADSILAGWHQKKVTSMDDIRRIDEEHAKAALAQKSRTTKAPARANRFNNFTQRDYDFDELERMLLS